MVIRNKNNIIICKRFNKHSSLNLLHNYEILMCNAQNFIGHLKLSFELTIALC